MANKSIKVKKIELTPIKKSIHDETIYVRMKKPEYVKVNQLMKECGVKTRSEMVRILITEALKKVQVIHS